MADERPSWKEIDQKRDGTARREKRSKAKSEIREHSTRYDKYKADLNRLFDQGMAGELLKKVTKKDSGASEPAADDKEREGKGSAGAKAAKNAKNAKTVNATTRRKGNGRIPKDTTKAASRLKLIRAVADAGDSQALRAAIDELVEHFGLPDDWDVLIRVIEHPDEALIAQAVARMAELLPSTAKVPRRASLKERLRSIGQTASTADLRQRAAELEAQL